VKLLASVLLLGVFIRHDSAWWIAAETGANPRVVFYVLGGAWEAVLCALILWALYSYPVTPWRNLAIAACAIGALEGAQMAACRMAIGSRSIPTGVNLCDYSTGLPVGAVMTSLYLLIICWHVGRALRERSTGRA